MEFHLILVFISVTAVLGQDVYLELDHRKILNNSVLSYTELGLGSNTLSCVTKRVHCCCKENKTIAEWFTPSGDIADAKTQFQRSWRGCDNHRVGYIYIFKIMNAIVTSIEEGLYHCIIPAPNGNISTLYVGIYSNNIDAEPSINGIIFCQLSPEIFTLTCTSTGGPATTVTWTLNGSEITYDANHVLTQTVVNTRTAEYNNTLTVTGREPGNYQCTVSNAIGSDTSQLLVVNNTVPKLLSCPSLPKPSTTAQSTSSSGTPDPSSPLQLPVAIAGAVAGLILCTILIVLPILTLTLYKRRKGTWPWGKKIQDQNSLQQSDDTSSSVNQNQTNPSTGQTLTVQPGDDNIKNKSYLPSSQNNTMADSSDPTYSVITGTTTPNIDAVPRETHILMKSIGQPNSLLTHFENDSTGDSSSTEQESEAEDWPKPIFGPGYYYNVMKHSAQSECSADPNTMEIVGPAGDVYAAVDKKTKKEDSPPPLPTPYLEPLPEGTLRGNTQSRP